MTLHFQNDLLYVPDGTKEGSIAFCRLLFTALAFTKSVTLSVAVSKIKAVLHQAYSPPPNIPELNPVTTRFRESYSSTYVCELQVNKTNEIKQRLIELWQLE